MHLWSENMTFSKNEGLWHNLPQRGGKLSLTNLLFQGECIFPFPNSLIYLLEVTLIDTTVNISVFCYFSDGFSTLDQWRLYPSPLSLFLGVIAFLQCSKHQKQNQLYNTTLADHFILETEPNFRASWWVSWTTGSNDSMRLTLPHSHHFGKFAYLTIQANLLHGCIPLRITWNHQIINMYGIYFYTWINLLWHSSHSSYYEKNILATLPCLSLHPAWSHRNAWNDHEH